jgi:LysM repeat protein
MKSSLFTFRILAAVVLLTLLTSVSGAALAAQQTLGQHVVRRGETLYCIGRAYAVQPLAIAQANGLRRPYTLFPGQVLNIPNVLWPKIPAGPVCARQFSTTASGAPSSSGSGVVVIVVTNTPGPNQPASVAPRCTPPEFFDPLLNRCRLDPNNPVPTFTPTSIPGLFLVPTSTPKPCIPPEFYDPFLNRCRLPDPTFTPAPTRTP